MFDTPKKNLHREEKNENNNRGLSSTVMSERFNFLNEKDEF